VWESVAQEGELLTTQHKKRHNVSSREKVMARDSSDFAQHSSERAMQAANFGMNWSREFAEQTFGQSRQAVDAFLRVTRKMAEDFENQATVVREHMTSLTEKTLSNTMEYGEKLSRAKEPQEFAQCQSDFLARQAQTIADQTKELTRPRNSARSSRRRHSCLPATLRMRWQKRLEGAKMRCQTSLRAPSRPRNDGRRRNIHRPW